MHLVGFFPLSLQTTQPLQKQQNLKAKPYICAILEFYAAYNGCSATTFWDNLSAGLATEGGIHRLFRNFGTELPYHKSADIVHIAQEDFKRACTQY